MNLVHEGVLPPNEPDDRDERREEREMAQDRDTVADIVAEMHREAAELCEYGTHCVGNYADRIEAAWEREREELDKRISDLEAYAKLWTDRADELRLKCDKFYAKAKPVGNAAAMREALIAIRKALLLDSGTGPATPFHVEVDRVTQAALSAPARNCDLYANAGDAWEAYDEWVESYRNNGKTPPLNEFGWLLAPAAERKGGNDGIK